MSKICPVCSQPFTPQRVTKEYCSTECRLLAFAMRKLEDLGWRVAKVKS